jgi:hypothetical protein
MMEPEIDGFPEIPKDFSGKVNLMREQVGKLLEILKETVNQIPPGVSTPESELLKGVTHDLGVIAPEAFQAFEDAQATQMATMKAGVEFADSLPARIAEIDARMSAELAPFAAANFAPKPPERVPTFRELVDFRWARYFMLRTVESLPRTPSQDPVDWPMRGLRVSGNIWENWKPNKPVTTNPQPAELENYQLSYNFEPSLLANLGLIIE